MRNFGISAFYHDSAAAILDEGHIVAAAQEERFTRKRFDPVFPTQAIKYCLAEAKCQLRDVDYIAFHEKPLRKFERLLRTHAAFAPRGFWPFRQAMPQWLGGKLFQRAAIRRGLAAIGPAAGPSASILFCEHHQSHAASAFFPSPFDNAVVLTMDGVGEWATTSVAIGRGNTLQAGEEIHFPHSLGLLYAAVTQYLGFKVLSGEYKVMGLAPYGTPRHRDTILAHLIDVKPDGSFHLDQAYFGYCAGQSMITRKFADLFGQPARLPDTEPLRQFHMDMAASVQAAAEYVILRLARGLAARHGLDNLCLAGGVALNCVANSKVLADGAFANMWIQPAAGDAGCALGAALAVWHQHLGNPRYGAALGDAMQASLLGPGFRQDDIEGRLAKAGAVFSVLGDEAILDATVQALVDQETVGWFQGRMEFGPRALGARSILADPRSPSVQKTLNLKVKNRESFRPFAPSVLREDVAEWFEFDGDSPYMLFTADVRPEKRRLISEAEAGYAGLDRVNVIRSSIPAVTHIDCSARIQTVAAAQNPRYHRLLSKFKERTGCPMLVNTSFNMRGEPIVCNPEDAFRCFMGTDIEVLAAGNCFLRKDRQDSRLRRDYRADLEPD